MPRWPDGGSGRDVFIIRASGGNDVITDFSTVDYLDLRPMGYMSLAAILNIASDYNGNLVFDFGTGNTLTLENFSKAQLTAEMLLLTEDTSSTLTEGDDNYDDAPGGHLIDALGGNDTVRGQDGNDTILGNSGDDLLYGNDGDDEIDGGAGNDTILGGSGSNKLTGGTGNDVFVYQGGVDTITDFSSVSNNRDVIDVSATGLTTFAAVMATAQQIDSDTVFTFGAGQTLTVKNRALNQFTAEDFGLTDTSGTPDTVLGGDTGDYMDGGGGNDLLSGGGGNDSIAGGYGDDTIFGSTGNDVISGGDGNDTLIGGEGNDWLDGAAGDDWLFGQAGHDTLLGGAGADYMEGGAGNDLFYGEAGNDTLLGGDGNDVMAGHEGNDYLAGGNGNDELHGGGGDDLLEGGADNDTLIGASGNDTLAGGAGDDWLYGQGGQDVFVFRPGEGLSRVMDFNVGGEADYVSMQGFGFTSVAEAGAYFIDTGGGVYFDYAGTQIAIFGISKETLESSLLIA
jgi:Ca2+-binding RTX toxin-like protein